MSELNENNKKTNEDLPVANGTSEFVIEKIKERPISKRKLVRRVLITVSMAAIFGLVACFTFLMLEPVLTNWLYPGEEPEPIQFVDEVGMEDEILPEDLIVTDDEINPPGEATVTTIEGEQIEEILSGVVLDSSDYQSMYADLSRIAEEASRSLVTVTGVKEDVNWFQDTYESMGQTSGAIFANNGREYLIFAQGKAVKDAQQIEVTFYNDYVAAATIKQEDINTGYIMLSVDMKDIPTAMRSDIEVCKLGNSNASTLLGNSVIAIGSPMGTPNSVSYGIVTSNSTVLNMRDINYKVLMTNIYGSSKPSGVLINLNQEVVGIIDNSYNTPDTSNMLCALGISEIKRMAENLSNGWDIMKLGVYGTDVTNQVNSELGVPFGAYIIRIEMDTPAMDAGIQSGDVITKYNDEYIDTFVGLTRAIYKEKAGSVAHLELMRLTQDGYMPVQVDVVYRE